MRQFRSPLMLTMLITIFLTLIPTFIARPLPASQSGFSTIHPKKKRKVSGKFCTWLWNFNKNEKKSKYQVSFVHSCGIPIACLKECMQHSRVKNKWITTDCAHTTVCYQPHKAFNKPRNCSLKNGHHQIWSLVLGNMIRISH
ncbi:hypothetical protein DFH05DRAFT_1515569 [Lentinula detonsa]|uniref:Uncharacterized protein n=1 Tax=Lentinula detonsa TaxID=2804962 RepID=A0A9W8NQR6_9AGAR|nr:hypothetical protein DFH05DRAFT_1515569 [Lentinula detonsa]